jgi:hypothetical protein
MVLAINGPWGTGKTTFIQMWEALLRQRGFATAYLNAWTSDFSEDPLVALLAQIESTVETKPSSITKDLWKGLKADGGKIVKVVAPIVLKAATAGALDTAQMAQAFKEAAAETSEKLAEKALEGHRKERAAVVSFRKQLTELAGAMTPELPFVVFVDELDRCRPLYAVQLLERIKHVFDAPGVLFVLSLDRDQLAESVKAAYGANFDSQGYLRRFIDLQFDLPVTESAYTRILFEHFGLQQVFKDRNQQFDGSESVLPTFEGLATIFRMSLRDQEQCFVRFNVLLRSAPKNQKVVVPLTILLIILKQQLPAVYHDFVTGRLSALDLLQRLRALSGADHTFLLSRAGEWLEANVAVSRGGKEASANHKQAQDGGWLTIGDGERSQRIGQLIHHLFQRDDVGLLKHVHGLVELTGVFSS